VFEVAAARDELAQWSAALSDLTGVAADGRIQAAIADPNLAPAKVAGLIISVLAGRLSGDAENLVRVLAENGRLEVLPEIRSQYEALKNEREGVLDVEVFTAFEMDDAQAAEFARRLERKTGRKVRARVTVDSSLIGGARIQIGDKVIDGSARAQLIALENALKA
jgi:F-type H+-transporting ATPase subunit delta